MEIDQYIKTKIQNVDIKEVIKYVTIMYTEEELREKCVISTIPKRQTELDGTQRAKPTLAYLDKETYTRTKDGRKEYNVPKWDWSRAREPSTIQRKKLIAMAIMMATRTLLTNHLYQFNEKLYKQLEGGPIGDDITRLLAEILMNDFIEDYRKSLAKLNLNKDVRMMKLYVDDLNQVSHCLEYGSILYKGKIYIPGKGWRGRSQKGQKITTEGKERIERSADLEISKPHTQTDREKNLLKSTKQ